MRNGRELKTPQTLVGAVTERRGGCGGQRGEDRSVLGEVGGVSREPEEDSPVGLGGRGSPTVVPVNQYPTTWRWPVI